MGVFTAEARKDRRTAQDNQTSNKMQKGPEYRQKYILPPL